MMPSSLAASAGSRSVSSLLDECIVVPKIVDVQLSAVTDVNEQWAD